MQITDEMMALAVKAYIDVDGKCRPAAMRAALSAALSVETHVKVKPLEFVDLSNVAIAHTPFGTYKCGFNIAGTTNHLYHMIIAGGELAKSFHETLEAAKAAAQADYEARILSALSVEQPTPQQHVKGSEADR